MGTPSGSGKLNVVPGLGNAGEAVVEATFPDPPEVLALPGLGETVADSPRSC